MKQYFYIVGIVLLSSITGCKKEASINESNQNEKYNPTPFAFQEPAGFPPLQIPDINPLTQEGVALGRMLYYDAILHPDSAKSCSSCHIQNRAFQNNSTNMQVLPHFNLGYRTHFMWKGNKQGTLEDVMLFEVEEFMQTNFDKLNNHPLYPALFKQAFGVDIISAKEAAFALAQFQRILVSGNSRYDSFVNGGMLTDQERNGLVLFFTEKGDCFHCHGTYLFSDDLPHNNGLDVNPDQGYFTVTQNPEDLGKFKTPSLRNIALTAPYMHDGRFNTLAEVVAFYSTGVHLTATTDPLMKMAHQGGVNLSVSEQADLVAFLHTLTDSSLLKNPEFSNPF